MADFSTDIQKFQKEGVYEYKFDSVGNLYFNSSSADFSQVYLKLPLTNVVYDNAKIEKFYDPTFVEFVPITPSLEVVTTSADDLQNQLNVIQQENATLKTTLDSVIAQSDNNSSAANQQAVKQVILELRKTLGQGRIDANFSDTFPYFPLTPSQKM